MKMGDGSTVWGNDKVQFVLYPEVYFKFVVELHKHHQDILRAMVLAQVKWEDGSAMEFLNTFLGTDVKKETPMELGFAQLLDALNMRIQNAASETAIQRVAAQFSNHSLFPSRSDPDKPMFDDEGSKQ